MEQASSHARTREAETSSDRRVVVVTVYREEAFVGDLPEREQAKCNDRLIASVAAETCLVSC